MKRRARKSNTGRKPSGDGMLLFLKRWMRGRRWKTLGGVLAAVMVVAVMISTAYALILPAVAVDSSEATQEAGFYLEEEKEDSTQNVPEERETAIDGGTLLTIPKEAESLEEEAETPGGEPADLRSKAMRAPIDLRGNEPAHSKTLKSNGDGSYTLSLSVTGAASSTTTTTSTRANVIIVFDTSDSMIKNNAPNSNETRLAATKRTVQKLATNLYKNNTPENGNAMELALITFNKNARLELNWTTNESVFNNTVRNLTTEEGTNWEAALKKVNDMPVHDGDPTYVIFVTDGRPTRYLHDNGSVSNQQSSDSAIRYCYEQAIPEAEKIVESERILYGIFAYGNNQSNYLDELINVAYNDGSAYRTYYFNATNTSQLEQALEQIHETITTKVGFKNVKIRDKLTNLTATELETEIEGKFTYTKSGGNYGGGTSWNNAPPASYQNGTVQWDLSGVGTLENEVTYTVSFVVWPRQKAYDLVADLNNGVMAYDDLPEEQKSQIIHKDGGYALKTNEEATVGFQKTKTVNGVEVGIGTPETAFYEHPEPMPLTTAIVTVKKEWQDSTLGDGTRPESVALWVTKDGENYQQVTLNAGNHWSRTIAIAPGIKVRPGDYGTDWSGKKAGFLTEGHVYSVKEDSIDPRYEVSVSSGVQPMLDGLTTNDTTDLLEAISGMKWTGEAAVLTASNVLKGSLKISKIVTTKEDASDSISSGQEFSIRTVLKKETGIPISEEIPYQIRNRSNHAAIKNGKIKGGILTEVITTEQYLLISGIPAGTAYAVTEETGSLPSSYQYLKTISGSGVIEGDTQIEAKVYNRRKALEVELLKVDVLDPNKKLEGAQFILYQSDGSTPAMDAEGNPVGMETQNEEGHTVYVLETGSDGKVKIGSLLEGTYVLKEIKAPSGYQLEEPIRIIVGKTGVRYIQRKVPKDGMASEDGQIHTLIITNGKGEKLPMTGGSGTWKYTLGGWTLIVTALMCGFASRRRKKA